MKTTQLLSALATGAVLALSAGTASAAAVIYEPFDVTNVGDSLDGKASGTGLTSNWSQEYSNTAGSSTGTPAGDFVIGSGSLSYGNLQAGTGNHVLLRTDTDNAAGYKASVGSTLSGAGLMADGATLWFSFVMQNTPWVWSSYSIWPSAHVSLAG